jgi:hypothetical protein
MSRQLDWFVVAISLLFLYFGQSSDSGAFPNQQAPASVRPETANLLADAPPATPRAETAQWTLDVAELPADPRFVEGGLPLTVDGRLSPIAQNPPARVGGDPRIWASMLEDSASADRRL